MALAPSLARSSFLKLASARALTSLDRASLAIVANVISLVANRGWGNPYTPQIDAHELPWIYRHGFAEMKSSKNNIRRPAAVPDNVIHRENFLYLIRCGTIESVPSRRILSF